MASGRQAYTAREDQHLVQFLATHNPDGVGRGGNVLWKDTLCGNLAKFPWAKTHSWQSWRDHYRHNEGGLNLQIKALIKKRRKEGAQLMVNVDAEVDPQSPTPAPVKRRRRSARESDENHEGRRDMVQPAKKRKNEASSGAVARADASSLHQRTLSRDANGTSSMRESPPPAPVTPPRQQTRPVVRERKPRASSSRVRIEDMSSESEAGEAPEHVTYEPPDENDYSGEVFGEDDANSDEEAELEEARRLAENSDDEGSETQEAEDAADEWAEEAWAEEAAAMRAAQEEEETQAQGGDNPFLDRSTSQAPGATSREPTPESPSPPERVYPDVGGAGALPWNDGARAAVHATPASRDAASPEIPRAGSLAVKSSKSWTCGSASTSRGCGALTAAYVSAIADFRFTIACDDNTGSTPHASLTSHARATSRARAASHARREQHRPPARAKRPKRDIFDDPPTSEPGTPAPEGHASGMLMPEQKAPCTPVRGRVALMRPQQNAPITPVQGGPVTPKQVAPYAVARGPPPAFEESRYVEEELPPPSDGGLPLTSDGDTLPAPERESSQLPLESDAGQKPHEREVVQMLHGRPVSGLLAQCGDSPSPPEHAGQLSERDASDTPPPRHARRLLQGAFGSTRFVPQGKRWPPVRRKRRRSECSDEEATEEQEQRQRGQEQWQRAHARPRETNGGKLQRQSATDGILPAVAMAHARSSSERQQQTTRNKEAMPVEEGHEKISRENAHVRRQNSFSAIGQDAPSAQTIVAVHPALPDDPDVFSTSGRVAGKLSRSSSGYASSKRASGAQPPQRDLADPRLSRDPSIARTVSLNSPPVPLQRSASATAAGIEGGASRRHSITSGTPVPFLDLRRFAISRKNSSKSIRHSRASSTITRDTPAPPEAAFTRRSSVEPTTTRERSPTPYTFDDVDTSRDQEMLEDLGTELGVKRLSKAWGFAEPVTASLFEQTGRSLSMTERYLRIMRGSARRAVLKCQEASKRSLSGSRAGSEAGERADSAVQAGEPSVMELSRSFMPQDASTPLQGAPSVPRGSEERAYSPPAHTRSAKYVRLQREGRTEEARARERRRASGGYPRPSPSTQADLRGKQEMNGARTHWTEGDEALLRSAGAENVEDVRALAARTDMGFLLGKVQALAGDICAAARQRKDKGKGKAV
ncbi:hypothetical protein HDZ31DRAFT_62143 [Schizophyllum fasciatum]